MSIYESKSRFAPWIFTVSHRSLLLRGTGPDGFRNTDLLFTGVIYCELPEYFDGLEIDSGVDEDFEYLRTKFGLEQEDDGKVLVLNSGAMRFYIVASHFRVDVNDLPPGKNNLFN